MSLHQHAKIFDLKILPADWLRAFWPISLESNFSQMLILYRNIANNINFNHIPNAEIQSQEILMIKFFNNFKTKYLRQNFFLKKSGCHAHGFPTPWSNSKKMPRNQDGRMAGQTDPISQDPCNSAGGLKRNN